MSSSARPTSDRSLQIVAAPDRAIASLPPRPPPVSSSAIVEYTPPVHPEDEDLENKLRRILDCVPVRVSNTSGSSAGSGSGDFHQYRQMRRKEQDRLTRMDVDHRKRKELAEFNLRREERLKEAEERTAKKRLKRQKKKQRKKVKKNQTSGQEDNDQKVDEPSDSDGGSDNDRAVN